uniref:Tryptophan synthase beta chain-like PALP domain-containing protein n=2 Tax=Oryza TaxID=4527 RepID=A0A0D3GHX9_9ORYZ
MATVVEAGRRRRAAVVVLGDIGRSPRMQYHSLSLANQGGMEVDIVANGEKEVEDRNTTVFTSRIDGEIFLKPNRPALVVSSTSWTPDEDFSILLEATLMYDRRVAATLGEDDSMDERKLWIDMKNGKQFVYPRLLFIITGKGPDRKKYEEQIKRLKLRRVAFRTMWLASEDYPLLLGSADLGVSLHTSSSGLDLPMKVVDMFGCGLPVCAASFSCIDELVKVNNNGLLFSTSSELADELMMLFKGFPEECDDLKSLKVGALNTGSSSKWSTEWERYALPLVNQLIGWTPLIEMKNIPKKEGIQTRLIGKMETYQPLFSVKDRTALSMIEDAEEKGIITPGVTTLIEPTSGNLGIGLVLVAIQKGYRFIAVMPARYSPDKQMLLRFLGAELILTDPAGGYKGAMDKVEDLMKIMPNYHCFNQATNPANPEAHFKWTGPEIWKDTAGKVDFFVTAAGTGGTLSGVGRYLKIKNPSINIVCVEPSESAIISGGSPGSHKIQGTGPGFIPKTLDRSIIDEVVTVSSEESMAMARRLAKEEGLLVGISSGANVSACIKIAAREENKGKMIVTMFPSGGERYMSSDLFADVREECANMTF